MRSFFKYSVITTIIAVVTIAILIAAFLFQNKAPIISGKVEYGIEYKNDLSLDLYLPTKKVFDTSPVIFYIHGGAWIRGTKAAINFNRFNGAINTLRENGYTIVAPDYTVAGKTKSVFPECVLDIYEAVEWTKKSAEKYELDTTNMGLLGESAGAHIAMMVAFPDTTLQPEKYKKTKFNYLIDVYGPNDLADIYNGQTLKKIDSSLRRVSKIFGSEFNIKEHVFGFDPSKDSLRTKELLDKFSPINVVAQNKVPVLIIHGVKDQIVPVEQSVMLKKKLDELGIESEMHLMDGVDHNFLKATTAQMEEVQRWVEGFVGRK